MRLGPANDALTSQLLPTIPRNLAKEVEAKSSTSPLQFGQLLACLLDSESLEANTGCPAKLSMCPNHCQHASPSPIFSDTPAGAGSDDDPGLAGSTGESGLDFKTS